MAESILRLKVESTEYDAKLKRAAAGLTAYVDGCRKVGGTLEVVEKETLAYVKALGTMDATARTSTGGLREMKSAFTELSVQYARLTKEEKASPFGVALKESLRELGGRVSEASGQINAVRQELDTLSGRGPRDAAAGMQALGASAGGAMEKFASFSMGLQSAMANYQQLAGVINQYIAAAGAQSGAELKLSTIMRERMAASDEEIDSIKRLAAAQQEVGVIGDEVQLAGAQQVATFLTEKESIEALLPAMNNLAAQRQGLNVTAEEMVNIGNLVGKVMQGNVGALTRVGITFSEAEKEVLKYGNESERAAMLAQVITNNVGEMNRQMAKTNGGKAKQLANAFGDTREKIGGALAQLKPFMQIAGDMGMAVIGVVTMTQAVSKLSAAIGLTSALQKTWAAAQAAYTALMGGATTATGALTVGVTGLGAAVRTTIKAFGPLALAFAAATVVLGPLIDKMLGYSGAAGDATGKADGLTEAQRRQAAQARDLANAQAKANKAISTAVGELVGKYQTLKREWEGLTTTADKTAWIKKNQSAFHALGLSVNSVNDAYLYFVKLSDKVVTALQAIAKADALSDLYKERAKLVYTKQHEMSVESGDYYVTAKEGDWIPTSEAREAGVKEKAGTTYKDSAGTTVKIGKGEAPLINALRSRKAKETRQRYQEKWGNDTVLKQLGDDWAAAKEEAAKAAAAVPGMRTDGTGFTLENVVSGRAAPGRNTSGGGGKNTPEPEVDNRTEEEKNSDALKALSAQYVTQRTLLDKARAALTKAQADDDADAAATAQKDVEALEATTADILKNAAALRERNAQLKEWAGEVTNGPATVKEDTRTETQKVTAELTTLSGQYVDARAALTDAAQKMAAAAVRGDLDAAAAAADRLQKTSEETEAIRTQIEALRERQDLLKGFAEEIKAPTPAPDYSTYSAKNVQAFTTAQTNAQNAAEIGSDEYDAAARNVRQANTLSAISGAALGNGIDLGGAASGLWTQLIGGADISSGVDALLQKLNDELAARELPTLTVDVKTGKLTELQKDSGALQKNFQLAAQSISSVGGALQSIEDPAAKVAGMVAAAVAQIALTFAQATSKEAKGGVWTWIAASAAGLATMITTITAIKSATRHAEGGFAGGFVPGNNPSGDRVPALLNSGELVLNRAQQGNLAAQLSDTGAGAISAQPYVTGETLYLGLNNYLRRRGYGELATTR